MVLKIHNTLTGTKEIFKPVDENHVRVYACGPTVYNFAHIGNARMAVANDLGHSPRSHRPTDRKLVRAFEPRIQGQSLYFGYLFDWHHGYGNGL